MTQSFISRKPCSTTLFAITAIIIVSAALLATPASAYSETVSFTPTIYPTQASYFIGQQVRLEISATAPNSAQGFNRTKVRIAIAAMYANRAQSGTTPVDCNSSSSSVYFDSGNLGISTYTNLGRYIVYQAYTTFSVPPFPYRICIRDQPAFGTSQYYPIEGVGVTPVVYNYTEIGLNFRASTVMQEGDFAAIAITKIGSTFPYEFTVPDATGLNGDSVKLVPAGYPCTMEGTLSRETAQMTDYCGSNRLTANGFWTSTGCLLAGSVANGVARMGTNAVNPFIDPVMTGFPRTLQAGESLTAYLQLPAYGLYDVCYSPLAYRLAQVNVGSSIGQPLWFKIMSYTSSCTSTSCPSRTRLQVTARIGTVTWSSTSAMIAGSYGSIRVRGAGDLNTNPATKWDPKCSGCTKEFYNTTGGDTFRLVNFASFQINPSFTSGTKVTITGTSTTFGSSTEGTVIDAGATANVGSIAPNAGCWVSDNDNYGTVETPMGMAACASCETGSAGQTASGDLGGDPRSGETTWRQNLANQLLTFSRVRVPSIGGTWRVCYRKAGINNWQYLDWDTLITKPYQGFFQGSATNLISIRESQMNTNFTYTLNDTRKGTWAQFQVASTLANMETTASNFFTTTVPQASVRGAMLKVIDVTQRCDDISQTAATALDGGLAECLPSQCGYVNGSCYGCSGSSDNTATIRRMITFNVLLPSNISSVRVCFRNRVENWRILTPRWNKRYEMPLTTAPDIQYYVNDTRTGSWGRFVFYHLGGGVIDTNTFTATRGSMFRLVPTSVRCDLIWTTSNTAQDYNNRSVDSRLGVVCTTTGTSPCLTTDIAPTSGGVVGSTPYLRLNPRTPDPGSYVPYAAGFALIPAAGATYRVCFREAKKNWIELSPQFTPQAAPLFSVSNLQASYTAGSYVKFTIAATNASINASAAIFKVVDGALNCEFPSVGTYGTTGLIYSSFSIATADGSRTISNGASSSGLYSAVDFYLTLPTATSTPTATTTNLRRICFMPETSASSNWVDLGRIGVVSYSIGYTVNEVPTNGKQFNLTIKAGSGSSLTTGYSGDAVKIVPVNSPCASNESGVMPFDVTSYHQGLEINNAYYNSILNLTRGVTYLGPYATGQSSVTVGVTLPGSASAVSYRVCYKVLAANVWMEILQTPTVNRTQDLGANGFVTIATDVHTLVINPLIAGAAPTSAYNYGGFLYPQLFIAGAATTFDPTTIGGSGSVANYFTVTGTSLSTSDTLRLLLVQTETQTIAQYTSVMVVSCADGAASANIAATYNPYSVNGGATEAYFQFMLPITPARYIFCYQKSGSSIWYQPGNAALNPAVVISSSAYGWIGDTTLTLNDGMQSLGANLGSLNAGDRVYIMSSTSTCGVGTTYQSATIASSAVGLTTTNVNSTGVYNSLTANSPSWYPVTTAGLYSLCYTKAIDSYTVQSSSLRAILSTGVWYQLQFYIGGYFQNNYRKLNGQANLIVTCPTSPQTTGTPFSVPIAIEDPSTSETLTSYVPVQVSVVATNSWSYINTGGTCSGSDRFNSTISTKTGTATFSITALSACPSGGCTFLFTSTESTNSSVCTFTLNAPNTIASLEATTDAACAIGSRCRVSISALDSTNAIVYASSAAVSLTTTTATFAGLGFGVNGATAVADVSAFTTLTLQNGAITLDMHPTVLSSSSWLAADSTYSVVLHVAVNGITKDITLAVKRSSLTSVAIAGVSMVNWDGSVANDADINQYLRWEPSVTFPAGYWGKGIYSTALQSGVQFPWIAGQYYKVTLVPLDPYGAPITDTTFYTGTTVTLSVRHSGNGTVIANNVVIGQPPNATALHSYQTAIDVQSFSATTLDVVFRLRSAVGCTRSSPCAITFSFGGSVPDTIIITSVRSVARKLVGYCGAPALTSSATLTTATCTTSAVELGNTVAIRAVDQFGSLDEFFNGDVYVNVLIQNKSAGSGFLPTTVSQLKQSLTTFPTTVGFVNGEMLVSEFTLSYPCSNCVAQFYSDWNVGYAYVTLNIAPSTVRLNAWLSNSSTYYLWNTAFTGVLSVYNRSSQANLESYLMVYPTTDLCFDVAAVSATGAPTLYESVWVNFAVSGQTSSVVTGTPASQTPFVYKPLNFSKGRFCVNVNGADAATFVVTFVAQEVGNAAHWTQSYVTGQSVSTTYRLAVKRLIGGLNLTTVSGMTPVEGANVGTGIWGRSQLPDVNTALTVTVGIVMLDHYGNPFNSTNLISSQVSFFLSPGACSSAVISSGQCTGNGASTSALKVTPVLPIREGGVVQVIVTTASYTLLSTALSFSFNVRRWCLKCDIPIVVYSSATGAAYSDAVLGTLSATLSLSVLIPTSLPLYAAFRVGNSPFFPATVDTAGLVATKWRHWLPSATSRPTSSNGSPMLFYYGCVNGSTSGCSPNTNLYSYGKCASSSPEVLTGADGGPMKFVVYRSSQAMSYGESICTGDCFTGQNAPTSQIDIFNTYTYNITTGTQRIQCTSSNAVCVGDGTGTISVTIPQLGSTVDSALVALAALQAPPAAQLSLVGVDASSFTTIDAISGVMLTGTGLPSKAGPLIVSATSSTTSSPVTSLTSTSGTSSSYGMYYLMWRGPARATKMVVRSSAQDMSCPATGSYLTYTPYGTTKYTGYLSGNLLSAISVSYSGVTIPTNTPFPFTVEIQDTNSNLVPSATGTIAVSIVDWTGCGNGGTVSVVGSNALNDGRVTLWLTFTDSCDSCNIRFDLAANTSQSDLYELVLSSAQLQSIVVSNIKVLGSTQNTSIAAFSTDVPSLQPSNITIDDTVTVNVAAYFNVGGIATLDNASALRIEAYNYYNVSGGEGRRQVAGDGGFLRLSTATLNFDPATVYATGTGSASLSFAFQRTCQNGCKVLIVWRILSTNSTGSFFLANANGTTFYVSAPLSAPMLVAQATLRKTIRYNAAFPYAIRTALMSSTIPFAGWSITTTPATVTPTVTVTDSSNGASGVMSINTTTGRSSMIYHLNFSEPCYACTLGFNTGITFSTAIQATATQLRIDAMAPLSINSGDSINAHIYASDDLGYVDFTIGGQTRCAYEIAFLCNYTGKQLSLYPSGDGVTINSFTPNATTYHVGGSNASTFSILPISDFLIRNGQANLVFNSTGPAAKVIPIVTDGSFSTAAYPTFGYSISSNLTDLRVTAYLPVVQAVPYETFQVMAAMTSLVNNIRYVVPNANHTMLLTMTGECNVILLDDSVYQRTVNGQVTYSMVFTSASTAACAFTVTSVSGNGVCSICSRTVSTLPTQRTATSWDFIRPTPYVPAGTSTAIIYAAMTRSQVITVQLYNLVGGRRQAQTCSGCGLLFTPSSCSPAPTFSPSGGAIFNSNGTATVKVTWQVSRDATQNSTIRSYSCSLSTSISGTSIDGPYSTAYTATVCYPARLVLVNGTFNRDVYLHKLYTSKSYNFVVGSVDPYGTLCPGDSQYDVSTIVNVTLEYADGTPVETNLQVINLNRTTQSASAPSRTYNNTVYLLDGLFYFNLVFTNASVNGPVRLRFTAYSASPAISMSVATPSFNVVSDISSFNIYPAFAARVSSFRTYNFSLFAGDLVPFDWLADNSRVPNVHNSSADYYMMFNRSFFTANPVTFVQGAPVGALVNGSASMSVQFAVPSGYYSFYFFSRYSTVASSPPVVIRVETPYRFAFVTIGFNATAPYLCTSDCLMPITATAFEYNTTLDVLAINTPRTFKYAVALVDENDALVKSETGLTIQCSVLNDTAVTANIASAPSLVQQGPLYVSMTNGLANFSIGFIGTTLSSVTNTHNPVRIQCSCSGGTCPSVPYPTTMPIIVTSVATNTDIISAIQTSPIIQIPTTITTLAAFNATEFRLSAISALRAGGVTYIQTDNAALSMPLTICLVQREFFGFADLGGTVCGSTNNCTASNPNTCPLFVVQCICPSTTSTSSRREELPLALSGNQVQVELQVTLANAPAFQPTTIAEVQATYLTIEHTLYDSLSTSNNPIWTDFSVLSDTITLRNSNDPTVGATQTPVPGVFVTPVPGTPTPAGASPVTVVATLIALIVAMVLQL